MQPREYSCFWNDLYACVCMSMIYVYVVYEYLCMCVSAKLCVHCMWYTLAHESIYLSFFGYVKYGTFEHLTTVQCSYNVEATALEWRTQVLLYG